jgi:hypothetical protein
MPMVNVFKQTLDSMNATKFTAKKNYDTNVMEQGYLFNLAEGTLLIVDETEMNPGKLTSEGIDNLKALATLIEE